MSMKTISYILVLFFVVSCGFKPMLAKNSEGDQALESIKLFKVEGPNQPRLQRVISENLGDDFGISPIYNLEIKVSNEITAGGTLKDSTSTRYKVKVTFKYQLTETDTQEVIDRGSIYLYSSYDVADSEFANYIAERYTNDNIIKELCEELKSRLILVLSSKEQIVENTSQGHR